MMKMMTMMMSRIGLVPDGIRKDIMLVLHGNCMI